MKGLSVLYCMIASLLPTLPTGHVLPPVAPGQGNHIDHRVQRELFQTVLTLNIPKPPPLGIKLSCTGNRQEECQKVVITHFLTCYTCVCLLLKFVVVLRQINTLSRPEVTFSPSHLLPPAAFLTHSTALIPS